MYRRQFLATTRHGVTRAREYQPNRWAVDRVLAGYDVRCLACDPLNPATLFAGTQGDGVFLSTDAGDNWRPAGLEGRVVKSVAASLFQPGTVLAGVKPAGVMISPDHGGSWRELPGFAAIPGRAQWYSPAEPPGDAYVKALALSPTNPAVIIAGIEAGAVVRSTDGGETWSDHREHAVRDCHTLVFHVTHGEWCYEAGGTGAAVSEDFGETWQRPVEGLSRRYCWAVAADAVHPEIWYVSASPSARAAHHSDRADAGIYRKRGDHDWELLAGGLPDPIDDLPMTLLTDPEISGHVYAGLRSGAIWYSRNYGDTWDRLPFALDQIDQMMIGLC